MPSRHGHEDDEEEAEQVSNELEQVRYIHTSGISKQPRMPECTGISCVTSSFTTLYTPSMAYNGHLKF